MTNAEKWKAALACDQSFDGVFFYAIKTTGIFCRPSCRSRAPLQKNVVFFERAEQAMEAGFRPCKRCRPDLLTYDPKCEIALRAKAALDGTLARGEAPDAALCGLGISKQRLNAIFKGYFGTTILQYIKNARISDAKAALRDTEISVAQIAYDAGFQSLSAFYRAFQRQTGLAPGEYRREERGRGYDV